MNSDDMHRQVDDRRQAVRSRQLIDEAVISIQARRGCDTEDAFSELWETSGRDETALRLLVRTSRCASGPRARGPTRGGRTALSSTT